LPAHVGLFFVAFIWYLLAVGVLLRSETRDRKANSASTDGGTTAAVQGSDRGNRTSKRLWLVIGVAVALRLATLATHPSLSDDLYRYIWDGRVIAHGINPYAFPPSAPEIAHLRDGNWQPINAKDLTTPYPPISQALFVATYLIAGASVKAQQIVATIGDLLVILALAILLRHLGQPLSRLLIYAWNPLTLMHFAHSAHNDGWLVALLVCAVAAAEARKPVVSSLALALGVLVKYFAGVVVPAFAGSWRPRHLALFAGLLALGFLPAAIGANPLRGVLFEAGDARFNDSLYYVVERGLRLVTSEHDVPTGPAIGLLLLGGLGVGWWRARRGTSATEGAFALIGLFLLLSPVVEPWYALWTLPFVAARLRPGRPWAWTPAVGWLLFSGLIVLTELTYVDFSARTWILVRFIEYGVLYGVLAWSAVVWLSRRQALPVSRPNQASSV
jgi:alpha-1,6-mannosyltransferase